MVLVEGVLLYREPVDRYFDMRVFLQVSKNEMLRRARESDKNRFIEDTLQRYKRKYIPVQEYYLENHTPKEKTDILIDNTDYDQPAS